MNRRDFTGQRYGRVVALHDTGKRTRTGSTIWLCVCDCGARIEVKASNLRSRNTTACRRCGASGRRTGPFEQTAINIWLTRYRRAAAVRGLAFTLDPWLFFDLVTSPCVYCGLQPGHRVITHPDPRRGRIGGYSLALSGVDRVDNSGGYVEGNAVSCCITCNRAKHTLTAEAWGAWLSRIAQHQASVGLAKAGREGNARRRTA